MKAYYCAGTHWDREWYEPFQEFRMWLVELVDDLIDLMEREPEYRCFHLDGQAVVLEDYLDIRPENRERLLSLIREGRIVAGPWYVLPDEWLISGESYIRNIMMGMRVCRGLGVAPMDFAYTPDQFGHIAALPMIMRGLGLQAGICWRGTQDENYPAHFVWVGPDGSRMPTFKLRDDGSYAPFLFRFHNQLKESAKPEECYKEHFETYLRQEKARTDVPMALMLDALDHLPADEDVVGIMEELSRRYPDVEFVWTSLEEYGREMVKHADKMPERRGELREPCRTSGRGGQYLIVHTISSRYPIKQRNDQCQALLEKWAEPSALFQMMAGGKPITRYLDLAWEYLIKNHPHDSICGCSVDQVHRDMRYRFDQCELMADGVIRRAMNHVVKASDSPEALTGVVAHNPLPFTRKGVFEVALPFKSDWQPAYVDGLTTGERVNKFVLTRKDGSRVPFQFSRIEHGTHHDRLKDDGRNCAFVGDVYHLAVELELPPCGHTAFRIEPTEEGVRNSGTLMTGPLTASNGKLAFTLNTDGTASLNHRASGREFRGLFLYEDTGDAGDGWTRGQLVNDIVFKSPGSRVTTGVDEDGPLRTVFRVEREFDLPRMMDRRTQWRSEDRAVMRVTDRFFVEKDSPCVRVRTRVDNTCMDHRLRVLFPSGIPAETSFAETPFAVVERGIDITDEEARWHERVNPEKAFSTFFGIKDAKGGLAVLAPAGLHEYEVTQTADRTLALTLFRSTFKTVNTAGEPDGELLGSMEFEYMLYPFAGEFDAVEVLRRVGEEQVGIRTYEVENLPDDKSFCQVDGDPVAVTALKPAEDGKGGIVRLWNPASAAAHARVCFPTGITSACLCDLGERDAAKLEIGPDGKLAVTVPPKGLATVRFAWQ